MNPWLAAAVLVSSFIMDALIATYLSAITSRSILTAMAMAGLTYGLQYTGIGVIVATTDLWYLAPGAVGAVLGTGVAVLWHLRHDPKPCNVCGVVAADPILHGVFHRQMLEAA